MWGQLLGTASGSSVQANGTADEAGIRDKCWEHKLRPPQRPHLRTQSDQHPLQICPAPATALTMGHPNRGDSSHSRAPLVHPLAHLSIPRGQTQWLRHPGSCHTQSLALSLCPLRSGQSGTRTTTDAPCTGSASTQHYSRSAVRSRQCGYSLLATCLAFAVAH